MMKLDMRYQRILQLVDLHEGRHFFERLPDLGIGDGPCSSAWVVNCRGAVHATSSNKDTISSALIIPPTKLPNSSSYHRCSSTGAPEPQLSHSPPPNKALRPTPSLCHSSPSPEHRTAKTWCRCRNTIPLARRDVLRTVRRGPNPAEMARKSALASGIVGKA